MNLRRNRKGLQGGASRYVKATPAIHSVWGVIAAEVSRAAQAYDFRSPVSGPHSARSSARWVQAHAPATRSYVPRTRGFPLTCPDLVGSPGRHGAPGAGPRRRQESRCGRSRPGASSSPQVQTPSENTESTDGKVVSSRGLPARLHDVRALWRRSGRRSKPARCCGCDVPLLFPQSSQHLPFAFLNARVEVGRTVMEG